MTYTPLTTASNVQRYYQGVTFSSATTPTSATVDELISMGTSIIFSGLASTYLLPISNTDDLLVLRSLCEDYVVSCINFILGKTKIKMPNGFEYTRTNAHLVNFYGLLDKYIKRELILPNSSQLGDGTNTGTTSYNSSNSVA